MSYYGHIFLNISLLLAPGFGHDSASSDSSDWDRTNADLVTNMLHDTKVKWIQWDSVWSIPWAGSTVLTTFSWLYGKI